MSLTVDWSVRAETIALTKLAYMTGTNAVEIKNLYRAGDLGPPPNMGAEVAQIPLYHAVAYFGVQEARKKGVALQPLIEALPAIAGAAYIRFQLNEIRAGHCVQRGGTPSLNAQLWALLHAPQAIQELERKLPGGPIETRRYACFTETGTLMCDDLEELGVVEDLKIVDAWSIPTQMKPTMPGTFLSTFIA